MMMMMMSIVIVLLRVIGEFLRRHSSTFLNLGALVISRRNVSS
jgi:hypothetical protein